ncbi:MAG TPA: bacteriohopanetetrol glucosamine biosynthesis glycosyltransferase HpnI [Terriglobia bacterium]|nr:bacteriohopanetetrol glucosamine biosynthesis glycosyltransferase HpnI [Terriglobia bacterium]
MMIAAGIAMAVSAIGVAQAIAGWLVVRRLTTQIAIAQGQATMPVTILKPLHGDEPLLEQALATVCDQDYPTWQVVFGVQDLFDTALPVVHRLQARYPNCDIAVVVDPTPHGPNHKVANLINMLPAAKHDVLVIADSDVHAAPDWLQRLVAALQAPGAGLATTIYTGLPAREGTVPALGALQINHYFLPGALLARALGRQDCLGATMMLRRDTLNRIGGLQALVNHLADDNVLGRLVQRLGLAVALADTIPATTVPETTLAALWRHELRWARTIRALAPLPFAASVLQYPIAWAALAVLLAGAAPLFLAWFALAWALRALAARETDNALALANRSPLWLLPLRELMSVAVMAASYAGRRVDWRGHTLEAEGFDPR